MQRITTGERTKFQNPLPPATVLAYASPAVAFAILLLPPYVFLPGFYTQTLGLPLAGIGYIVAASRLFDAVIDPLVGFLSDRTASRYGRRKIWIAAGIPVALISVFILFIPPSQPSLEQFALGLFGLTLGWTLLTLPYTAWGAELSGDYHERTRIAGSREAMGLVGTLLAASTPTVLSAAGYTDPKIHMAALAILVTAIALPTVACLLAFVAEPPLLSRANASVATGIKALLGNAPLKRLISAYVLNGFANGLPATLFLLFVSHVIGAKEAFGPLLLSYFIAGLVMIPVWTAIARRVGKHRAWAFSMISACAIFAFTPFVVGPGDIVPFFVISILSGASFGADLVLPSSIQADVVDIDTHASGEQRTGLLFAAWAIATKLAFALSALSFPLLAALGFDADAFNADGSSANDADALMGLVMLYAVVPVFLKLIAIALVWHFPLDAAHQARTRDAIERKEMNQ